MEKSSNTKNGNHKNPLKFNWILPTLFTPKRATDQITAAEKPVWLTPLLVVSVMIMIAVFVAGPIRKNAILMNQNMPEGFEYYSADQQAAFMSGQANRVSPLFLYIFPILTGLGGLWISWFLLSSLLHLSLTLSGSRASNVRSYNLAGWSFLPLAVKQLVQIIAMLATKAVITSPGLSGFMAADVKGFAAFFSAMLGLIDIYLILQMVILFVGVGSLSGLSKSKAGLATVISLLVLILLQTLPGFLSHALSGISTSMPFFF